MTAIPVIRRLLCALVALTLSGFVFRGQLADAVVLRGDEALRQGDMAGARRAFERALRIDRNSIRAADRLAFQLLLAHTPEDAQRAVLIASGALAVHRDDAALLADRALAEVQLHAWRSARRDFIAAAERADDPRYDRFAGRIAAARLGDAASARADAQRAARREHR